MTTRSTPEFHLRPTDSSGAETPKRKPVPAQLPPVPFHYSPSPDGTDANLLVLLHGLGDTLAPFAKLGRSLALPRTAVLALRGPQTVPYLDPPGYQWFPSFDRFGLPLEHSNPEPGLEALHTVILHMIRTCGWRPAQIHLFGFAQGGSLAGEFGVRWWRGSLPADPKQDGKQDAAKKNEPIGSIVSICGPLVEYPTIPASSRAPTPALVFHRQSKVNSPADAYRRAYENVHEISFPAVGDKEVAMPKGKEEWQGIMKFWSERLVSRVNPSGEDVYEVIAGGPKAG